MIYLEVEETQINEVLLNDENRSLMKLDWMKELTNLKKRMINMYRIKDVVYLNEKENKELLSNELHLTKIIHVDDESDVPLDEYPHKYIVGKDLDLF